MNVLKWIKYLILHFLKRIFQITSSIIITVGCGIIYAVTYEPGKRHIPTPRKIRRIRFLTKLKLYVYKWLSHFYTFSQHNYLKRLYNRFHFLIDK